MRVRKDAILKMETNDRTGTPDDPAHRAEREQLRETLAQKKGVSYEEQLAIREVLVRLIDEDAQVQDQARRELTAMSKRVDVMQFLHAELPSLNSAFIPPVLEVMVAIDAVKALDTLRASAAHPHAPARAKAISLLARLRDSESAELAARGLIDEEARVIAASALALGQLGEVRATPILIGLLERPSPMVRRTAQRGLEELWLEAPFDAEEDAIPEDAATWQTIWLANQAGVPQPYDASKMMPLVPPGVILFEH